MQLKSYNHTIMACHFGNLRELFQQNLFVLETKGNTKIFFKNFSTGKIIVYKYLYKLNSAYNSYKIKVI